MPQLVVDFYLLIKYVRKYILDYVQDSAKLHDDTGTGAPGWPLPTGKLTNQDAPNIDTTNQDKPNIETTNQDKPYIETINQDKPNIETTNQDKPNIETTIRICLTLSWGDSYLPN